MPRTWGPKYDDAIPGVTHDSPKQIALPAKILNYFLRSNKSNINQNVLYSTLLCMICDSLWQHLRWWVSHFTVMIWMWIMSCHIWIKCQNVFPKRGFVGCYGISKEHVHNTICISTSIWHIYLIDTQILVPHTHINVYKCSELLISVPPSFSVSLSQILAAHSLESPLLLSCSLICFRFCQWRTHKHGEGET